MSVSTDISADVLSLETSDMYMNMCTCTHYIVYKRLMLLLASYSDYYIAGTHKNNTNRINLVL